MVRAGEKGQYQGLFEVTLDGEKTVSNSLVPFNAEVGDDPEVKVMLKEYNDKIVALYGGGTPKSGGESTAPVALRNSKCEPCHTDQYEKWKSTDHAKAYSTLVNKSKQFDPTCLACHTTLFGKPDGFNMEQQQMDLVDIQCESCHGDAKEHLSDLKPIPVPKPPVATCVRCHTKDRCPDFEKEYDKYWRIIAH
jgi:hypothetical protein